MTKITAQPALSSTEAYLRSFAAQTLNKDQGPWIMHNPDDRIRPKDVTRGMVLFYQGEIGVTDDMDWCWGGKGDYAVAAYYPLEVRSDVEDDENPLLYWNGKSKYPRNVKASDLVEVIFRDGDRRTDPADEFSWKHGSDAEGWDIVAYRVIPESPLLEGVWNKWVGNEDDCIPKDIQPHTKVSVRLRDGDETSYMPANSWNWSVDHDNPCRGDIIAFKIKD